ncbi:MAG: hypothetical protein SFX73_13435 [Kofleriaceae bacterium]|nr:hypothetical protein [Kofleriaceae bacterium]
MTTELRIAVVLAALASACALTDVPPIDLGSDAPPLARAGCALVARRCTRCHPLDRVLGARVSTPTQWRSYVRRMRLVPASGIAPSEEAPIVECLVHRSFGATGVAALHAEEEP